MTFLNSILKNSKKYEFPFNHWEYNNALSEEAIKEIEGADIPDVSKHNLNYDGTRAIDGGAAEFREGIASGVRMMFSMVMCLNRFSQILQHQCSHDLG